jgi:anti-sigma B factor antagonist
LEEVTTKFTASADRLPGGGRVVHVRGQVDLYAAPDLKAALLDALERGGGRVVVDLTGSTFLDSSALSALLSAHRRAQRLGGRVVLVNTDRDIARTLGISGLDGLLEVAETVEDARELLDAV